MSSSDLPAAPPARFPDAATRSRVDDIVKRVLASGRARVAVAKTEGREVIRVCVTHGETSLADAEELVGALEANP